MGSPPFLQGEEIEEGHGLVAMGTEAARPYATAEDSTIRTALVTQIASVTGWAFVDGSGTGRALRDRRLQERMTTTPGRLATGRRAHLLAPHRGEQLPADRAGS